MTIVRLFADCVTTASFWHVFRVFWRCTSSDAVALLRTFTHTHLTKKYKTALNLPITNPAPSGDRILDLAERRQCYLTVSHFNNLLLFYFFKKNWINVFETKYVYIFYIYYEQAQVQVFIIANTSCSGNPQHNLLVFMHIHTIWQKLESQCKEAEGIIRIKVDSHVYWIYIHNLGV